MALPALQVRVPNPANALLQAEQIKGARSQNQLFQQQQAGQNALLSAFQGGIPTTPAGQTAAVNTVAQVAPQMALQLRQQFGQLNAQDQAQTAQEAQLTARTIIGVRDQAGWTQALSMLPPGVQSALPAQYDPQIQQSVVNQARTIEGIFADQRARLPTPGRSAESQAQELALIKARALAGQTPDNTLVQVVQPDGSTIFVPRSQAAGQTAAPPPSVSPNTQAQIDADNARNQTVSGNTQAQIDAANARNAGVSGNTAATLAAGAARNQATIDAANARFAGVSGNTQATIDAANNRTPTPNSSLAEINADLSNNLITQKQALLLTQQALAPGETWRPATPAERQAFGLPEDQAAQISTTTGKVATIGSGGVEVNVDLSTKTQGQVEGDILNTQDALDRLTSIESSFDPTFQQIFTRAGIKFDQLQARFGDLSPEDRSRVERAAVFQQNAIENVNSTIRALTGAQMSQFEAARITSQLPSPGTGVFDGDDPVTFEAKMRNATRRLRVILARRVYAEANGRAALSTGFDMDGTVREIVNQRGKELQDLFESQGLTGTSLDASVDERLQVEFGGLL